MSITNYAKYKGKSDDELLRLIVTEEWHRLVNSYGGYKVRQPRKPYRDPRQYGGAPSPTLVRSLELEEDWSDVDGLIDRLKKLRKDKGNLPLSLTSDHSDCHYCGDFASPKITYRESYPNPMYASRLANFRKDCDDWDNFPAKLEEYNQGLKAWIEERDLSLQSQRDARIDLWNDRIRALKKKQKKAMNYSLGKDLDPRIQFSIISQLTGYRVRLNQINLLLAKYSDPDWFPSNPKGN